MKPWFPAKETWPDRLPKFLIKRLQRALNNFFTTRLDGIPPLIVDGAMGDLTRKRIVMAKFFLGRTGKRDARVNRQFVKRLRKPNATSLVVGTAKNPSAKVVRRGKARRRHHDKVYRESQSHYSGRPHWITYDGKMLAAYFGPINDWARKTGAVINGRLVKWKGGVVSGGRTAEYSRLLCRAMCGQDTCPGRCAGIHTNHVGNDPHAVPSGAEDVSDYVTFGLLMQHCPFEKLGCPHIHNELPNDRVHFSPSGR